MRKVHETSTIWQPFTILSTHSFRVTLIMFLSPYSSDVAPFAPVLLSQLGHQFHFASLPSIFVMELHTFVPTLCRVSSFSISLALDCA